jgi:hypothetical protein
MPRLRTAHGSPVRSTRSSVLVIVLVTLLFTAVALVAFIEQASSDLLVEARVAAAKRLRREAYSALEVTLATLQDFSKAGNGLHHPAEGWGDPLGFAGWTPREGCTAEVTLEDESGKIPLAKVDRATLVNVFKAWQLAQADAERLADSLLVLGSTSDQFWNPTAASPRPPKIISTPTARNTITVITLMPVLADAALTMSLTEVNITKVGLMPFGNAKSRPTSAPRVTSI